MSYEAQVMRAATEQLAQRRADQSEEYRRRREQVYARLPRLAAIDRELRQSVASAAVAAFRSGSDPAAVLDRLGQQNLALQEESARLLRSIGLPEDYLDEKPVCPLCRDSGWVGARMCQCLRSLCTQEQNRQLSSLLDLQGQSFDRFRLDYYGGVYSSERAAMQTVFHTCKLYAEQFATFPIRNLLMTGRPGVGKTYLSACIARSVSAQGVSVVYDTAIGVFSHFEAAHFTRDEESQVSKRRYLRSELLILDDLGSEMTTPFIQSALYELVNERLLSHKATVISTNLTPEDLGRRYSLQATSRLLGEYQLLQFQGPDIRQEKKKR